MKREISFALLAGLAMGIIVGLGIGYWFDKPVMAYEAFDSRVKCFAYFAPKMHSDQAAKLAAVACEHLTPSFK